MLSRPVSFGLIAALFFAIASSLIAYMIFGEYTKKARVSGYLVPDKGLIKIHASQDGTILSVRVSEGQSVRRGDLLAVVSTERAIEYGATQEVIAKQLSLRQESLVEEKKKTYQIYTSQINSAQARLKKLRLEIEQMGSTIDAQQQRVILSEAVVARNGQLIQQGFLSDASFQEKRSELLEQQNRLRELQRGKIALERELTSAMAEVYALPLRARNEVAALERSIFEMRINDVENEARRESLVLAPHDGLVTALQVSQGKRVTPAQPLMSLLPAGSQLQADLYIPSRSAGFVRAGQTALLQYHAFPYQKFGSYPGKVTKVSRIAVPAQELPFPVLAADVYYVVTVLPDRGHVLVYGKPEPLQAGMQVDADIWLDRRTIAEWILEPLYSVSGRI